MMMKSLCSILLLACSAVLAQQPDESLTFDAAAIKAATLPVSNGRGPVFLRGPSGGPGTKDPGRINFPYMTLKNLLMTAYDVKNFQISGPGWLDTERFEINATMPPETTKEQFKVMLRNLLAERFKLTIHRETKELPTYALLVNKGGPKVKESPLAAAPAEDAPLPPPLSGPPKIGPDGFPEFPAAMAGRGGIFTMMMPGRGRFVAQHQTMEDLANRLTLQMDRPVTDATGLTAKYDFILTFSTEGLNGVGPLGPLPPPPPPLVGGGRGNENVFVPDGETPMTLWCSSGATWTKDGGEEGKCRNHRRRSHGADPDGQLGATYAYDGEGRRVSKTVGTTTTTYVYDAQGQLAAEYGPPPPINGTWYLTNDALGSTRLMKDGTASSTTERCSDYLPFGEEIPLGYAGRGTCYYGTGYPSAGDVVDLKFTGKERDVETGLDFFVARYMSGAQGRFTSPDPVGGSLADPQTLNKYAYVRNSPLNLTDPTGLYACADDAAVATEHCTSEADQRVEAARQRDLQSRNATFVERRQLTETPAMKLSMSVATRSRSTLLTSAGIERAA